MNEGKRLCDRCDGYVGLGSGPSDGWELENGEVICHECCVSDTKDIVEAIIAMGRGGKTPAS